MIDTFDLFYVAWAVARRFVSVALETWFYLHGLGWIDPRSFCVIGGDVNLEQQLALDEWRGLGLCWMGVGLVTLRAWVDGWGSFLFGAAYLVCFLTAWVAVLDGLGGVDFSFSVMGVV